MMGRLRDAWDALRGYAAAQESRASSWAASGSSATAEVGAAAPTRLRDLGDYEAALLMKAKIEACLAAVVSEDGDDAMTGPASGLLRDSHGRTVESFEPGMILYRRGMGSVEVVNPSGGGSHAAFARRALEASAVGTGLTYDQVAGDLTQANYSSLRAGKIEFRRLCEQVQYGMLIPMLVRPIADRFHAQGALLGLWGADVPDGLSHVPPAHEMIDPLKDTTALIAQVRAGFVPQPEDAGAGYSTRMPAARTTGVQRAISLRMKAVYSAGVVA
ncbi:MAG: phage portal protein [Roseomonas sp.]|nr:phage portal protein [Roseomonas sp.]